MTTNHQTKMKQLKIGYIMQANSVDMSNISGPQQHVKAVFEGLKKRGHNVRMVAIQHEEIQWTDDLLNWYPGEFGVSKSKPYRTVESFIRGIQSRLNLPFFRLFDSYRFSDACVSAFPEYDVLYERDSTMSYGGLIAAKRLGIPIILEVNGDLIEEWEHLGLQFSRGQRKVVHYITRQTYQRASHIVTVGKTIRQRLIHRWALNPSHVSVVTNGVDIDLFINENASTRKSQFIESEESAIVFVGGFQPWHGIELILDAFSLIAAKESDARLILVGDGPLRPFIQDRAHSSLISDRVIFTGSVDHADVSQLLNEAAIAVIYHRGSAAEIVETPLKLFEYMAAGAPIVAPAVPNMERILTDRINALLVPPDNPEALASAFVELLEDNKLRESIGQAAREEAIERHSWDRAVCELESLLHSVLEISTN